jgi:uncharacterized damage-inducible protein DinB
MRTVLESIETEYHRYKDLGDKSFAQVGDAQLNAGQADGNSIAMLVWHIGGNLRSRFTDFLTTDGEKPWRDRESEFDERNVTRAQMIEKWEGGWKVLLDSLRHLDDDDLARKITIRSQELTVLQALQRSLAHTSYHVGQIVFLAKALRGGEWTSLTIPRRK